MVGEFEDRATSQRLTVAGVHLKSGLLGSDPHDADSATRKGKCDRLSSWLGGQGWSTFDDAPPPASEVVVVLGDFNAVHGHWSIEGLRTAVSPLQVAPLDAGQDRWTTYYDNAVIDHVFVSPSAESLVADGPRIRPFDLHPDFSVDGFLRKESRLKADLWGTWRPVPNLYRVSDHRPVTVDLALPALPSG
jgi:predicted extracellular nuclease